MRGVPATPLFILLPGHGRWQQWDGWDGCTPHQQACPSAMSAPFLSQSTWWRPLHDCSSSFDSFNTLWHNLYSSLSLRFPHSQHTPTHTHYLQFLRIKEEPVFSPCEVECYNKFEKDGLKAAEKVFKEAIKKCQNKCDDGDKKCEKNCDKGKGLKVSESKM